MAKKTIPKACAGLIAALKFVAPVKAEFCVIMNHWLIATNGVLSAAYPIEEDLNACPHVGLFLDALQKCGEDLAITQLSESAIAVRSGEFKAMIPCGEFAKDYLNCAIPDANIATIDDRIKDALNSVLPLCTETEKTPHYAGCLLQAGSAAATNGAGVLEYWHGHDLPAMLVPGASCKAIYKAGLPLTGFGYSGRTATFYFGNGAFYKTALFENTFPAYNQFFAFAKEGMPMPEDFFHAVNAIATYSQEGKVYFDNGYVSSRERLADASTYRLDGLPTGMGFNAKYLMRVRHAMQKAAFDPVRQEVIFYGDNVRGILRGLDLRAKAENATKLQGERQSQIPNIEADDVPF